MVINVIYKHVAHTSMWPTPEPVTESPRSVTDLINRIVQVLRGDLYWVRISARDAELMEPVEPWDEG